MTSMLFYENLVALNREQHRDLKLDRTRADATFAAATHYVPLAGTEFEYAARNHPILFAGAGDDSGPIALFSLTNGYNPYVDAAGQWRAGTYVPAFVRRYPLILAHGEGDQYTVCIDQAYPGLNEDTGDPLFDDDGKDSPLLRDSVMFLDRFRADMQRTAEFRARLDELELLVPHDLQLAHPDGQYYTLKDFRFVDPERLDRLPDAEIVRLQRDGYLGWIHAHRISLANLAHLEAAPGGSESGAESVEAENTADAQEAEPETSG